jgi:hypothetical protein
VVCTWLLLVLFDLLVAAAMNILAGEGVLLCVGRPTQNRTPAPARIKDTIGRFRHCLRISCYCDEVLRRLSCFGEANFSSTVSSLTGTTIKLILISPTKICVCDFPLELKHYRTEGVSLI